MRPTIEEVYESYADGLYRYALMLLGDHSSAEDAVQQVFAGLVRNNGRVAHVRDIGRYAKVAVRNECYRMLKDKRRRDALESGDTSALLEQVDAEAGSNEEREKIEAVLRHIPAEQREVIHLKVYENMTFSEISGFLEVSINTVASRYRYAMDKLRLVLAG